MKNQIKMHLLCTFAYRRCIFCISGYKNACRLPYPVKGTLFKRKYKKLAGKGIADIQLFSLYQQAGL